MRRSAAFGGQEAAFDSHSCLSRHDNDADFRLEAARWKQQLRGNLNPQIWASAHENFHWAQYIGTGLGSFLNRLRSERDRHIMLALHQLPVWSTRIEERISGVGTAPLFDYDTIRHKLLTSGAPVTPIEWAVAYDLLEHAVYYADAALHWVNHSVLLDHVAVRLLRGDGDTAFSNSPSPSTLVEKWPKFDELLSTEQLLEAQAVLFETFYTQSFALPEQERWKRFIDLQPTPYTAPTLYAIREMYNGISDPQFEAAMQNGGVYAFWISVIICIDLAVDIYFPAGDAIVKVTSIDWCPPLRFAKLVEVMKTTGLIPLELLDSKWTNSREVFSSYREMLKSGAGVRISTDHDFVLVGDYADFEAVSRMRFIPEGGADSLLSDVLLYDVISKIQELVYDKKKGGIAFLHDPLLNLKHANSPAFSNYYDAQDFRLAYLSVPLNISYSNGSIGSNMGLPILAAQAERSSFSTYALYGLAFESGTLQVSPWKIRDDFRMSNETLLRFFGKMLKESMESLRTPAVEVAQARWESSDHMTLGAARPTTISRLNEIGSDWPTYQAIAKAEGHVQVIIELKEDFLRNHAQLDREACKLLNSQSVVCYLQMQTMLTDGKHIGLKVHLIDQPAKLICLTSILKCRLQLSGKLLARTFREDFSPWLSSIEGMPLSILLDADVDEILEMLVPVWEWLAWQPYFFEKTKDSLVMTAFPIGGRTLPDLALFRPCTPDNANSVRDALRPFAFPAAAKDHGIQIFGMSEEQRNQEWKAPVFLNQTVRQYYEVTAQFVAIRRTAVGTAG
jgi:hypothetical protein